MKQRKRRLSTQERYDRENLGMVIAAFLCTVVLMYVFYMEI